MARPLRFTRQSDRSIHSLFLAILALGICQLNACGGGSGSGTGGGGNGGGGGGGGGGGVGEITPSIIFLSPSKIMVGVPLGQINVNGANFTVADQVFVDGAPAVSTAFESSTLLEAQITLNIDFTAATHQISVHGVSKVSNSVSWSVYAPVQGPQPFNATPGYFPDSTGSINPIVADVNGDGFADVVIAGPSPNFVPSLSVMLGQSNGQLGPPIITPGIATGPMVVGDVMGDGSADIVTATFDANQNPIISILMNDGKGNFSQGPTTPFTGIFPNSLMLVDMDGDGKLDLLLSVQNSIYFLKNQGGGSFSPPVTLASPSRSNPTFLVADFNGDSRPDIVYAATNMAAGEDQIHLLINLGADSFLDTQPVGITGPGGYFAIGDFNNDGNIDIALDPQSPYAGNPSGSVQIFFGNGDGTFLAGPETVFEQNAALTYQWVVGDFDHDGSLDLAGTNGESHITFLWGDGSGNFAPQSVNGPSGFSLLTADINADGIPDVVVPQILTPGGAIFVILGRADRNFPSIDSLYSPLGGPISVGDVNGDHKPDFLSGGATVALSGADPVPGTLYLNQGNEQFPVAGRPPGQGFLLADLNGDGLADLIGTDGSNVLIWPGNGDPNFAGIAPIVIAPPVSVGFYVPALQIADMDGDGLPDLIMPNYVLYNQGSFNFVVTPVTFDVGAAPFVIGDFNGDGILDIAADGTTLLGQPNRSFQIVNQNNLGLFDGVYAAVGDLNGDGKADVVLGQNGDPIVVYDSKGDGTFYEQTELNAGPQDFSQSIAVVDVNGDGIPDIVACLFLTSQCVVFTNDGQGSFERSYFASGVTAIYLLATDLNDDGKPDLIISNFKISAPVQNFVLVFAK